MIIMVISGIMCYAVYFGHYSSIRPFQGEAKDNINILRSNPNIDQFYTMYEKYEIYIADMTESQVRFAFIISDEENRHVTFSVKYFDGKPSNFYHACDQVKPRERVFLEENYIKQNCFDF